jgi:hypothetical protein
MPSFYGMLARMMVVSQSFVPAKRPYLAAELPRFSNALATASAIHVITIHLISICITSEIATISSASHVVRLALSVFLMEQVLQHAGIQEP